MHEVVYKDGEWPEVVILMLTWGGPPELGISEIRLKYMQQTISAIREHLKYPNLSWHIADDGSLPEYQERALALLGNDSYTFTDTKKGWDVNNNWNTGMKVAFERADVVGCWPDDRFLSYDFDVKSVVRLLMSYEDVCHIRMKPHESGMLTTSVQRVGQQWWMVEKQSPCRHVVTHGPCFRHKRYLKHYGYFPDNLWPLDLAEDTMDQVFRNTPGPEAVTPEIVRVSTELPWGTRSTWESKQNSGVTFREKAPWQTA